MQLQTVESYMGATTAFGALANLGSVIGLSFITWKLGSFIYRFAVLSAQRSIASAWKRTKRRAEILVLISAKDHKIFLARSMERFCWFIEMAFMSTVLFFSQIPIYIKYTLLNIKTDPHRFYVFAKIALVTADLYAIFAIGIAVNLAVYLRLVLRVHRRAFRRARWLERLDYMDHRATDLETLLANNHEL